MEKVLFISYFAPPEEHIGALRVSKFLKYLPQYGYQPYILAGGHISSNTPFVFRPRYLDPYLIGKEIYKNLYSKKNDQVYYDLEKIYTKYNMPKGLFPLSEVRMPDKFLAWILPAVILGMKLLNKEKFDLIYSSSGPPSSAIVASILQRYSGLPWIAEFRDLWSDNHHDLRKTIIHNIDNWIERQTLKNCNALVTVSEPLKETLERKYSKPVYVIYNGYDEEDYPQDVPLTNKFTITYTGKIYIGRQDITPLFKAVKSLYMRGLITQDLFQIRFWGDDGNYIKTLAKKHDIEKFVFYGGRIFYMDSLLKQKESWMLLLIGWKGHLAEGVLTGKLFDYLGAQRPILYIGEIGGEAQRILEDTGMGKFLSKYEDIENFLINCIDKYLKSDRMLGFIGPNENLIKYSRRYNAKILSRIFDYFT